MTSFKDKVAIVTGGGQGLGKATCNVFLDNGMKVCVCDVNEDALTTFLQELPDDKKQKIILSKYDVSSLVDFRASFRKTLKAFGRIDVLVNNASIVGEGRWKKLVDVNFIGVIHGITLAFEFMGTNNGGSGGYIINVASDIGLEPFPIMPIYSSCKHGVIGLTKNYGNSYHVSKTGVTVNALCPGPMETSMFKNTPTQSLDKELCNEICTTIQPLSPEDVAQSLLELLQAGKNGAIYLCKRDDHRYVAEGDVVEKHM